VSGPPFSARAPLRQRGNEGIGAINSRYDAQADAAYTGLIPSERATSPKGLRLRELPRSVATVNLDLRLERAAGR
jgi:hypothetical protein